MAKHIKIILGIVLFGAGAAELGRRILSSSGTSPSSLEETQTPEAASALPKAAEIPPEILTKEAEIRRLFAEKNYREALQVIENERKHFAGNQSLSAYLDWLNRQLFIVKTAHAWTFLEKQNCAAAMTILEEIPEAERPLPAIKGLGYCKVLMREWEEADRLLSEFLGRQTQDHDAIRLLAQVKEAKGDYDAALELTESLQTVENEEAELEIEPLRKSLLAKQDESLNQLIRQGPYFTLHYQPSLGPDFLDQVADALQKVGTKLNSEFGIDYPEKSVDIYFHAAERFGEITHGPEWAAGVYDGSIRLPVPESGAFTEETARVIRHEFTHALLSEMVGRRNLPTWFQEGFAQVAECEQLCRDFDYAATTQKFMPLEKFEGSFLNLPTREAQVAYKQSLYLTLLLIHHRPAADIRQMFSTMSSLETLNSQELLQLAGWSFPLLHQTAINTWEKQISLRSIRAPH